MAYFLFLAAALAVAGIGYRIRTRWDVPARLLMTVGGLGCVSLIVWQVRDTLSSSENQPIDYYHAAASYTLGSHVAREMAGQRGQVVLIYPPAREADSEAMSGQTYVFARVLRSAPGLLVRQTNLPAAKRSQSGRFSLMDFERVFSSGSNDLAYVSFAGIPPGVEGLALFQKQNLPRLFVYDPLGTTDWLAGLKKGVIRRVIVPRPGAQPAKKEELQGRPEELFNRFFLMATPDTADQVAAQLSAK